MPDPRLRTSDHSVPSQRWRWRWLPPLVLGLGLFAAEAVTHAADATAGPAAASGTGGSDPCLRDERCNALYESAVNLSKAGQFAAALANYEAAYRLQPVPWLLVNIGRVQQKSGNPQAAIDNFQRYLALPPAEREPDTEQKAQDYLKQAQEDLRRPKKPLVIREREERGPRPLWRILTGSGLMALGVAGIGIGATGLAWNGQCTEATDPMRACREVYSTLPTGIGFTVSGSLLAIGGAILVALPGPRSIVRVEGP